MMNVDADALQCDLAETYHIYNMYELPLSKVALFSYGLRDNSRIKLKIEGLTQPIETLMLAKCMDDLNILVWQQTKDGIKGKNIPKSIFDVLIGKKESKKDEVMAFDSVDAFEKARQEILRKGD